MLAAIRKFFRPPAALTRQRQQDRDGASQDDSDLEASVGDASQQYLTGDEQQHDRQSKGHKNSRWQKQAAKLEQKRDKKRAAKEAGKGQAANNKYRVPACGGLGDSGSDSSSRSSSGSSDTTLSSSSSSSSTDISANNELDNTPSNAIIQDEARLQQAETAALGQGQLTTGVAEFGDCSQQHQQQPGHRDTNESDNPSWEQKPARAYKPVGGKDFNFDYEDDEKTNEEEDDSFMAEDQNQVAFIAEVGNANTHRHDHYSLVATSPTNGLQANAMPITMSSFSSASGAPFQASVTPGTVSSSRKTDVDQLLTGATSVANQRRDSVRGNLEELRVAESVNFRPVVYKYSFKIPDTPANMRVFTDPDDRRIEAIARSCDSQIHLEKLPMRPGNSGGQCTLKMRKITIQSPDLHSLEKCCRQFDDRFKHFYVSGGLGLSGKSIQRVYVDELDN